MQFRARINLALGNYEALSMLFIPYRNLLAVACSDSKVRLYYPDTNGRTLFVFKKHQSSVIRLLHLVDDILASLDSKGTLFTWNMYTGSVVERISVLYGGTIRADISPRAVSVLSKSGRVRIMAHTSGWYLGEEEQVAFRCGGKKYDGSCTK